MAKKLVKIPSVLSMSSLEIAELTGKLHTHVIRDIEKMFSELDVDSSDYQSTYKTTQNKRAKCYNLDKHYYRVLLTGYDPKYMEEILDIMDSISDPEAEWENMKDMMKETFKQKQEGNFYIYQFKDFLKIGISKNDPHGRLKSHQHDLAKLGHSDTVVEQHVIKTAEYKRIERDVISHFAEYATIKGGEWFKGLTASAVIKFIGE